MALRNIAIIAHVDHGKTTLVDRLLQQSGAFRENQRVAERAMDSNDLERERGITILAKVTSILWQDTRINIVDTPGHADFGGEVERILNMVDGALVLVDAAEGPLPQTKFVVSKALKIGPQAHRRHQQGRPAGRAADRGRRTRCSICSPRSTPPRSSSISRSSTARPSRAGWRPRPTARRIRAWRRCSIWSLGHVAPPTVEDGPFRMLGTILEANPYLGRIVTGRITSGAVKPNQTVKVLDRDGKLIEEGRVTKVLAFRGLERTGGRGGLGRRHRRHRRPAGGDRVAHASALRRSTQPLPAQPIDPPTLAMTFRINDSPLAGTEGDKVQSRVIRERLLREAEGNVALRISEFDREGFDGGRRPRRTAARHPDRDHAARRLRALGVAAEGAASSATPAASCSSRSRRSSSTSTRSIPASSCRSCPSARPS